MSEPTGQLANEILMAFRAAGRTVGTARLLFETYGALLTIEQYAEVMKLDPEGVRTQIKRGVCAVQPVETPGRRGRYWHYASVAEALDKLRT